jgi:hypothetical protein
MLPFSLPITIVSVGPLSMRQLLSMTLKQRDAMWVKKAFKSTCELFHRLLQLRSNNVK